jgi:hypothetical protein
MKLITMDGNGQSGGNPGLTVHQRQLLNEFNAIDAESQCYVLAVLHAEYERANRRRRTHLRVVAGGAA